MAVRNKPRPRDLEREKWLRRAFLLPESLPVGSLRLRPFTLWTLDFCDELGLHFFVDPTRSVRDSPIPLTRGEQLAALAWAHDEKATPEVIDQCLFTGTWPGVIREYERTHLQLSDVSKLVSYIRYTAQLIEAASIDIRPRKLEKGQKREKLPRDLLNPAGRTALIWSVSGGAVQSGEQQRYLYREMPLPVLLQYYHAACQDAQLLTVAPGRRNTEALSKAKERTEAALAKEQAQTTPEEADDYL